MKSASHIPQQFKKWSNRNVISKMQSLARLDKALQFSPGSPAIWNGQQVVVLNVAGPKQRLIRLMSGQTLAVDVVDLKAIAREFSDPAEDDDDEIA